MHKKVLSVYIYLTRTVDDHARHADGEQRHTSASASTSTALRVTLNTDSDDEWWWPRIAPLHGVL
eukprot:scaffold2096_cov156-Isochrysis_galbana.AAC.2